MPASAVAESSELSTALSPLAAGESPSPAEGGGLRRANSRTSALIFIEQNLGPHIEQKCAVLAPSAGSVWSWNASAVSGSSDRLNWSRQRKSKRARLNASSWARADGWPLARSAAWAASL